METLSNLFNRQINSFTEEQFIALDHAESEKLVVITGPASTGKTLLEFEKALRSARANLNTLILFPTRMLQYHWKSRLEKFDEYKYIEVEVMHGLAKNILEKYNIDTSTMKLKTGGINDREYILKATEVAMYNDVSYDTIIVDEAQELTRDQVDFIDALYRSDFEHDTFDSVYLTGDFVHQRLIAYDIRGIAKQIIKKMMMMVAFYTT